MNGLMKNNPSMTLVSLTSFLENNDAQEIVIGLSGVQFKESSDESYNFFKSAKRVARG